MSKFLYLGSDHAGFALKAFLAEALARTGWEVTDMGCYEGERADYPVVSSAVSEAVIKSPGSFGILVCGSGIGMSIAANRYPEIRCAVCSEPYSAKMARAHNDANVLSLGARVVGTELALMICRTFLDSEFEAGRHVRRVEMLDPR